MLYYISYLWAANKKAANKQIKNPGQTDACGDYGRQTMIKVQKAARPLASSQTFESQT